MLGVIDIQEFFPSVHRAALETVFGSLPVHRRSFGALLAWTDMLSSTSALRGLPVGCDASQLLANALLVPGDQALAKLGVPFVRYVDDTWCFLDDETQFAAVKAAYRQTIAPLGLKVHPDKTRPIEGFDAWEEIERTAIQYAEAALTEPHADEAAAARELFSYAMEDPDLRRAELRRALSSLKKHRSTEPFDELVADVSLIALAPGHWRGYLSQLLSDRKAAKRTHAPDWVLDNVLRPVSRADAYTSVVLLQAAKVLKPTKAIGERLLEAALNANEWAEPVQVGAAHLWGQSGAFKPGTAVDVAASRATFSARRAFALTLARHRGHAKMPTWLDGVRRADRDLDATVAYLGAA